MDPSNMSGLRDMNILKTANELCEFVHCCRWMSLVIPNFAALIEPLTAVLESAYAKTGRCTKRSIKGIRLHTLSWGTEQEKVFHC